MHAVLITFTSSANLDSLQDPFTEYAKALKGVAGLVAKTWIRDDTTLGGFHIFTDRSQAESYLKSKMVVRYKDRYQWLLLPAALLLALEVLIAERRRERKIPPAPWKKAVEEDRRELR